MNIETAYTLTVIDTAQPHDRRTPVSRIERLKRHAKDCGFTIAHVANHSVTVRTSRRPRQSHHISNNPATRATSPGTGNMIDPQGQRNVP